MILNHEDWDYNRSSYGVREDDEVHSLLGQENSSKKSTEDEVVSSNEDDQTTYMSSVTAWLFNSFNRSHNTDPILQETIQTPIKTYSNGFSDNKHTNTSPINSPNVTKALFVG